MFGITARRYALKWVVTTPNPRNPGGMGNRVGLRDRIVAIRAPATISRTNFSDSEVLSRNIGIDSEIRKL
jgi:hypothetical protein